ncbi:hypothetical protein OB13_18805, partial [Pontibacter sp. HJ8]
APYTYSINGTTFQTGTTFTGLASGDYTLTVKDANGCQVTASVSVDKEGPASFVSSSVASTCGSNNGSLAVNRVNGGNAPYTYSLNGGAFQSAATFTGLVAGTYTITVKDANDCTYTREVQVTDVAGPDDLVATVKATTCGTGNGELTITSVSKGTAPYTYSLNGTNFQSSAAFTALVAGEYQVTVKDANGCIYTEAVVVPNISGPADFVLVRQSATCGRSNGQVTVSGVTGGTAAYTYSKDGVNFQAAATLTGLAAGTNYITVKDANGCTFTKAVVIENIPGPEDVILASVASTCGSANGSISVGTVTGGTAPYTYSINGTTFQAATTFEGVLAGEQTITVKDANGCTIAKKIVVENVAGPANLAASMKPSTCGSSNGELTITGVTGGTAPYTYSIDGVNFRTGLVFPGLAAGQHTLTVKDTNGCTYAAFVTITNIAGPSELAASSQPATCADNDGSIKAGTVIGGTAPYTYSINGTTFQSSTTFTGLASGDYTLTVKDANGCQVTTSVKVNKNIPTEFTSTTLASTCGAANGSITVGTVTGGTAPYTYSKDGITFQTS